MTVAISSTAVFIASRFDEFAELRAALRQRIGRLRGVAAIDLNDGAVTHRPPLEECLLAVRRSDLMVLLLGDTYGSLAPGRDKSFTHLEYEEATRPSSSTRVLVFCIGESYRGGRIRYSDDPRLAEWQRTVEANHTLGFLDPELPVDEAAELILRHVVLALHDLMLARFAQDAPAVGVEEDVLDSAESEEGDLDLMWETILPDERTVARLDMRFSDADADPGLEGGGPQDPGAAALAPAAAAAQEQRREAARALRLGEPGIAIAHLRRALDLLPLSLEACYWLARLYVALGLRRHARDAVELAERAARIAQAGDMPARAAASLVIAAAAAGMDGQAGEAVSLARKAVDLMPSYGHARLALARHLVAAGYVDEALAEIREAFSIYPPLLHVAVDHPAFAPISPQLHNLACEIAQSVGERVRGLLDAEHRIAALARLDPPHVRCDAQIDDPVKGVRLGRESVRWQLKVVRRTITELAQQRSRLSLRSTEPGLLDGWSALPGIAKLALVVLTIFLPPAGLLASYLAAYDRIRPLKKAGERAREMLMIFEYETLGAGSRFLPFPSLGGARRHGLVRVSPDALRQWQASGGRRVELEDELPAWLPVGPPPDGPRLYRVVRDDPSGLVLSRWGVYAHG